MPGHEAVLCSAEPAECAVHPVQHMLALSEAWRRLTRAVQKHPRQVPANIAESASCTVHRSPPQHPLLQATAPVNTQSLRDDAAARPQSSKYKPSSEPHTPVQDLPGAQFTASKAFHRLLEFSDTPRYAGHLARSLQNTFAQLGPARFALIRAGLTANATKSLEFLP